MIDEVSDGKKPCIWMEAGVVDFKMCHHCFDCNTCEFDRAMTADATRNLVMCEPPWDEEAQNFIKERLRQRSFEQFIEDQAECFAGMNLPLVWDVFGFAVPNFLYLHQGHTWAAMENCGRVRIGLNDFSQKVLGSADEMRLPSPGEKLQHDQVGLCLARQRNKAEVLAPLDGIVEVVNAKVRQRPGLAHDDPYGDGWLFVVTPTNLKPDLENLLFGRRNVAWIESEAHKLLGMLESAAGVTLPSGGIIVDDVFGHYPQLGWRCLVQEFLHTA